MEISELKIDSPLGPLRLAASNAGLCAIRFAGGSAPRRHGDPKSAPNAAREKVLARARRALERYFSGEPEDFADIPLDPAGTVFQRQVWETLRAIPRGETRSYGEIAAAIGRPGAGRAVGSANRLNPIPIVVPCHRVIGSDGALRGYAGRLDRKEWLLRHENARSSPASGRKQAPLF
jgi:methylated-DNA-[protein]-cysteine S-methyltransferase